MVTQMFVQIYTEPACSPMVQQFAENYRQATVREMPRPLPQAQESTSENFAFQVKAAVA
jgi:hypothetical protein